MGGRGSGGHPSAGSKPREVITGDLPAELPIPADLTDDQRAIWMQLAPLAREQRTLIPATASRFRLLVKAIVMEAAYEAKILADGLTYLDVSVDGAGTQHEKLRAHPLCGAHRGMMQRVEAGMVAFKLAPFGKAMAVPVQEKPKSALEALQAQRPGIRAVK